MPSTIREAGGHALLRQCARHHGWHILAPAKQLRSETPVENAAAIVEGLLSPFTAG